MVGKTHGHFHWPVGASSFKGSAEFHSFIFRARDSSASAFKNKKNKICLWKIWNIKCTNCNILFACFVVVIDFMHWCHPAAIFKVNNGKMIKMHRFVRAAHRFGQWTAAFLPLGEGALLVWHHVHQVYTILQHYCLLLMLYESMPMLESAIKHTHNDHCPCPHYLSL